MKLYLVQHGEALAKDVDPVRPLSETGRSAVRAIGGQLAAAGLRVGAIMHSGKPRAEQTAALLAGYLETSQPIELRSGLYPKDAVAPLAAEAASWHEDTMLVLWIRHLIPIGSQFPFPRKEGARRRCPSASSSVPDAPQ